MDDIQSDIIRQVRYVLDTCVIVSALRSERGASNRVLRLAFDGRLPLVLHYKLVAEYRAVLTRMVHARELVFTLPHIERLLAAIVNTGQEVEVRYLWRPNLTDEGDNFVYEVAFAASPATIVTHTIRDFESAEGTWPGLVVKTPRKVLKEIGGPWNA